MLPRCDRRLSVEMQYRRPGQGGGHVIRGVTSSQVAVERSRTGRLPIYRRAAEDRSGPPLPDKH